MPDRSRKRPRDPNQLAKFIVEVATSNERLDKNDATGKNPAAVALGRLGGLKGGKARKQALSQAERSRIALKAAKARWSKKSDD